MIVDVLTPKEIESMVIYLKDGTRIEFCDIMHARIFKEIHAESFATDYEIELSSAQYRIHTKRYSKRYVKNRRPRKRR